MTSIAKEYIARARPIRGGGFHAEYAFPGGEVRYVLQDGAPRWFEYPAEATAAAGESLAGVLNSRPRLERRGHITRMAPAAFAVALAGLRLTPSEFARIYGQPQVKVMDWIDGREPLPHAAHVLVRVLAIPGALKEAMQVTADHVDRIGASA